MVVLLAGCQCQCQCWFHWRWCCYFGLEADYGWCTNPNRSTYLPFKPAPDENNSCKIKFSRNLWIYVYCIWARRKTRAKKRERKMRQNESRMEWNGSRSMRRDKAVWEIKWAKMRKRKRIRWKKKQHTVKHWLLSRADGIPLLCTMANINSENSSLLLFG